MSKFKLLLAASVLGLSCCSEMVTAIGNDLFQIPWAQGYAGISRVAIRMINNKKNDYVFYFYSNKYNDGQNRWYQHQIDPNDETWNWTWCSGDRNDLLEVESINPDGTSTFYVFVSNFHDGKIENVDVYTVRSITWINPHWNQNIWEHSTIPIYYFDQFNYHTSITFSDF